MNNPNKTNTFTFQINRRRLARMKRIISFDTEFDVGQLTGQVEYRLKIAFYIIEIDGLFCQVPVFFIAVAADNASQHQILTNTQRSLGIRHKA